MAHVR